jgi:hypothetical protein
MVYAKLFDSGEEIKPRKRRGEFSGPTACLQPEEHLAIALAVLSLSFFKTRQPTVL